MKNMTIICSAMHDVAEQIARENGFILVANEDRLLRKDKFWGNSYVAVEYLMKHGYKEELKYEYFKFVYPIFEEEKNEKFASPKIELDMHFGNPRLTVYHKDNAGGFCLTYSRERLKFSEAQVFGEHGFEMAIEAKTAIESILEKFL